MKHYYLTLFLLLPIILFAQQPEYPKKVFVDTTGRYFQQASLPLYFFIGTSANGKPLPLQSATKTELYLEGHGVHSFKHENSVTNKLDILKIYADGRAPITAPDFLQASLYSTNNKAFYGPGLEIMLGSKDEMSGVDAIYHSLNGRDFSKHDGMPVLFKTEGDFVYKYYAVDRTGNAEGIKEKRFTVDLTAPASYHNFVSISSDNVISTNSSIYLSISDSASGVAKTYYKFGEEKFKIYRGNNIVFKYLPDGYHTITYYSVDNVKNKETEKSFTFYLDKTAPIMSADILGDKFLVGNKVYFSGRTKLKLTAVDNKSGIKRVMFSINGRKEVEYSTPFYLPNKSGIHNVTFYAIDHTGNPAKDDFRHSVGVIYVDLTGPSISHSFAGPKFTKADTVYISPVTKIVLKGNDPESGLNKVSYSLGETKNEIAYVKPFSVETTGRHHLKYFAYDNVNNRNSKTTYFIVDANGPDISHQFSIPPTNAGKYPSYTTIYLAAMDIEVGAGKIRYSINSGAERTYSTPLKGFEKDKEYKIKIKGYDLLGNFSETELIFKTDTY